MFHPCSSEVVWLTLFSAVVRSQNRKCSSNQVHLCWDGEEGRRWSSHTCSTSHQSIHHTATVGTTLLSLSPPPSDHTLQVVNSYSSCILTHCFCALAIGLVQILSLGTIRWYTEVRVTVGQDIGVEAGYGEHLAFSLSLLTQACFCVLSCIGMGQWYGLGKPLENSEI